MWKRPWNWMCPCTPNLVMNWIMLSPVFCLRFLGGFCFLNVFFGNCFYVSLATQVFDHQLYAYSWSLRRWFRRGGAHDAVCAVLALIFCASFLGNGISTRLILVFQLLVVWVSYCKFMIWYSFGIRWVWNFWELVCDNGNPRMYRILIVNGCVCLTLVGLALCKFVIWNAVRSVLLEVPPKSVWRFG